jgi:DNA modification methylase
MSNPFAVEPMAISSSDRIRRDELNSTLERRLVPRHLALRLAPKRNGKPTGTEAWFPYYAGFTETFVREILCRSTLKAGAVILDPWNGSGVTTRAATDLGFTALGIDLSPVAVLIARAKLATKTQGPHLHNLAALVTARALAETPVQVAQGDEPLLHWLGDSAAHFARGVQRQILAARIETPRRRRQPNTYGDLFSAGQAFLTLCLIRAVRNAIGPVTGSNPTWQRVRQVRSRPATIADNFLASVESLIPDLCERSQAPTNILLGDARALPLNKSTVDLILTSPPYCTRLDYIVSTSLELAILGTSRSSKDFCALRRSMMGTPLTRARELPEPAPAWGSAVSAVLKAIREHASPDSGSYYYKNYWQYFADTVAALNELRRVLVPGGKAILVLQTSYYKEIEIALPDLYADLARQIGFDAAVLSSHSVKRVITTINSRSLKHRRDRQYREEVLELTNRKDLS